MLMHQYAMPSTCSSRRTEQSRLNNAQDRQSWNVPNVKCRNWWRRKKCRFEGYGWFDSKVNIFSPFSPFHSMKNESILWSSEVKSDFDVEVFFLRNLYDCASWLCLRREVSLLSKLWENRKTFVKDPLVSACKNIRDSLKRSLCLVNVSPVPSRGKLRQSSALPMIKPRIISTENEDEDEDASWKAVYELRWLPLRWYETLKQ